MYFSTKLPLPLGDLGQRLIAQMVPWAHPSPQPKRHLDRFNRFCRDHGCVQQTVTQTDTRPRYTYVLQQEAAFLNFVHAICPNSSSRLSSLSPSLRYFNVRSKADKSQLNLPHGTNN